MVGKTYSSFPIKTLPNALLLISSFQDWLNIIGVEEKNLKKEKKEEKVKVKGR